MPEWFVTMWTWAKVLFPIALVMACAAAAVEDLLKGSAWAIVWIGCTFIWFFVARERIKRL